MCQFKICNGDIFSFQNIFRRISINVETRCFRKHGKFLKNLICWIFVKYQRYIMQSGSVRNYFGVKTPICILKINVNINLNYIFTIGAQLNFWGSKFYDVTLHFYNVFAPQKIGRFSSKFLTLGKFLIRKDKPLYHVTFVLAHIQEPNWQKFNHPKTVQIPYQRARRGKEFHSIIQKKFDNESFHLTEFLQL